MSSNFIISQILKTVFFLPQCPALGFVTEGKMGKNFYLHKAIIIKQFILKYPVEGFYEQILTLKTSAII